DKPTSPILRPQRKPRTPPSRPSWQLCSASTRHYFCNSASSRMRTRSMPIFLCNRSLPKNSNRMHLNQHSVTRQDTKTTITPTLQQPVVVRRTDSRRRTEQTQAEKPEGRENGCRSFCLYRAGVPVACSHGGARYHRDGNSHCPGVGHHRDGLVWGAGSTCIGTRPSRIQHGEVSQPLHAAYLRLCNPGLRGNCSNDHRIARADLYSIPCLRQARLVVLGLAQGLSRIQLLQGGGRGHAEWSVSCSRQLLRSAGPELVGPFID